MLVREGGVSLRQLQRIVDAFTAGALVPREVMVPWDSWLALRRDMIKWIGVPYTDPDVLEPNLYWRGTLIRPYPEEG